MNLETATPAQREAILTDAVRVLCVAGPGSGKSSTVVSRISRLIASGTDPKQIAAISFTNAASRVLQERLAVSLATPGKDAETLGANSTLHAFALRCLKEFGGPFGYGKKTAMIAPDAAEDLMAAKAETLNCKTSVEKLLKAKAAGRPPRGKRLTLEETVIATYLDELKEAGVVDYDCLLHEFLEMLTSTEARGMSAQQAISAAFSHLFVDEVQDSAPIDWAIYRALPIENKFLVGDSDQNIYEFRGARVSETVTEADSPLVTVIKLEENFRSKVEICNSAQQLIARNENRVDKATISTRGPGGTVVSLGEFLNEGEEIAAVAREIGVMFKNGTPINEIAVIARTNAICDGFRRGLPSLGIPVVQDTREPLPRDWTHARALIEFMICPENDSLAYFYVAARNVSRGMTNSAARQEAQRLRTEANAKGQTINSAFLGAGAITRPDSALGALTGAGVSREAYAIAVERWRELPPGATLEDFTVALASVQERVKEGTNDGVHIHTVHGAKGREYGVVFVVGCEDEVFPGQDQKDGPAGIESARRCLFVAMTRAKDQLYFTSAKTRTTTWKEVVQRKPSRFLGEIGV